MELLPVSIAADQFELSCLSLPAGRLFNGEPGGRSIRGKLRGIHGIKAGLACFS